MNNNSYMRNKENFCTYMEEANKSGRLISLPDEYILTDGDKILFRLDINTGNYLGTKAGRNKSNKRAYVNLTINDKKFMCPDYWAKIACDYLIRGQGEYIEWRDGIERVVINHINGNTQDCRSENIEVTSYALNNAHSRLMSEIHYWYPNIVAEEIDCQGNKIHVYTDGIGISCKKIDAWNKRHKNLEIRAFKDKKDNFRPRFSKSDIDAILSEIGG